MLRKIAVGLVATAVSCAVHAAWYDNPVVRTRASRPAGDPHYMNLSEDGKYLLLDMNAANNPAKPVLLYKTEILEDENAAQLPLHTVAQTLTGSKGGAVSATRGVFVPGFGTATGLGYKAYSLTGRADAGTALTTLTATGLVLDGLDFNAAGDRLYSNSYASGTQGNLVVLNASDLANITLLKTVATGLTRIRSVNVYTVGGRDLVYFGEGAVEDGAAAKLAVYDPAADEVVALGVDRADLTKDVMCVKLSGTKSGVPLMYVLLNDGRLFVWQLRSDGLSVASAVPFKSFTTAQVAAFCGVAASTTKFRDFEVLDDGSRAYFTAGAGTTLNVVGEARAASDAPYVEFHGDAITKGQSIDTRCKFGPKTAVVADFAFTDTSTVQQFVWEGGDAANNVSRIYVNGSKGYSFTAVDGKTGNWQTFDVALSTTRYIGIVDAFNNHARILNAAGAVVKNQDAKIAALTHTKTSTKTIKIGSNSDSSNNFAHMKLYGFRIYESDVLVRDYVPSKSCGFFGLVDRVTGDFISDARVDDSVYQLKGSASLAADDDDAPYIESNGSSTMNTRFKVSADSRVEVDYALLSGNANQARIVGADGAGDASLRLGVYINGNGKLAVGFGIKKYTNPDTGYKPGLARHKIVVNLKDKSIAWRVGDVNRWTYTIPDAEYKTNNISGTSKWPLLMFGAATDTLGFNSNNRSKVRIYRAKFQRAGVLVHDYVPCVKGGVPGFRDLVDGAFITGENVAAFTAGGNVERIEDDAYVATYGNNQDASGCNKFFPTGYRVSEKTRIEFDYALAENYRGPNDPKQNGDWFLFDAYLTNTAGKVYRFNAGNNKLPQLFLSVAGKNWSWIDGWHGQTTGRDIRRTLIIDNPAKKATLVTSGFTNSVRTVTEDPGTLLSQSHLVLAANNDQKTGLAPLKIYGCRLYEDGVLQRNYVPEVRNAAPGLYDTVNNTFLTPKWSTCTNICEVGGAIAKDAPSKDAYLEFTGVQSIDTGVMLDVDYCVKADFSFTKVANLPEQQFVAEGGYSTGNGNFDVRVCYTNSKGGNNAGFSWTCGANYTGFGVNANFQRYQSLIDLKNNKVRLYANGTQVGNGDSECKGQASSRTKRNTISLKVGSNAKSAANFAYMRLYGLKVWQDGENGTLVRDLVPYKSGETIGLYDKVEGKVYVDTIKKSPLGIGGEAATLVVEPQDTSVSIDQSKVLRVLSPGAVSYQWYCNGQALAGKTGETLTVKWRRGLPHMDVFSVVPMYLVNGETVRGPASEAEVTYSQGLSIFVR